MEITVYEDWRQLVLVISIFFEEMLLFKLSNYIFGPLLAYVIFTELAFMNCQ